MGLESVPGTNLTYHLIAFDAAGRERLENGAPASQAAIAALADEPITDVFLMSHGWQGDVPAARAQYQRWIGAMAACDQDVARAKQTRSGFRPLLIGVHWPSQPWGDERLGAPSNFAAPAAEGLDAYAARLGDTPATRGALQTILAAAEAPTKTMQMPASVNSAYETLDREIGMGSAGVAGHPGADREPFRPEEIFDTVRRNALSFAFSLPTRDDLLAPLRTLSFWKMKDRARQIGEGGGGAFFAALQQAADDRPVKFHVMGHSFGCIVVSAMVQGAVTGGARPVDSLALVQGALSLWSYCDDIPPAHGNAGYFRAVVASGAVRGPVVTTQSPFDTAVGRWYPLAAGAAGQVVFALTGLPKYGGVGAFGVQGPGPAIEARDMLPTEQLYGFEAGKVYNLAAGQFIRDGGGFSGAHSDITKPAVAHAVWEAALAPG
jgi:hypothetical protein